MQRLTKEQFLQSLQSVRAGLASRPTIELSTCFIFNNGKVLTFDDEVACRADSHLDKKFRGAIKAGPVLALLEKLEEEEIQIEQLESSIKIKGSRKSMEFSLEQLEGELEIDKIEEPTGWKELPADFGECVETVAQCVGTDAEKFKLMCVHLTPKWIEATDDFQAGRYKIKIPISEPVLIRGDSLREIASMGLTEMSETPGWLHFRTKSGLEYSCRRILEEYPDLAEFLVAEGTSCTFPKGLSGAITRAAIASKENADDNHVVVEMLPGKIRVRGIGISVRYFESREMPSYKGDHIRFVINPLLLSTFVEKFNECTVSKQRLNVDGGRFKYCAWLGPVEETQQGE
jgi:DNA polymerase III sliding clamp (beta) subunit (PCNA family)